MVYLQDIDGNVARDMMQTDTGMTTDRIIGRLFCFQSWT
jgi:hypothetical protein